MQAARIFKHQQSYKCHKSTERRFRWRDVEMAARCGEMEFNLDGEEGDNRVQNVRTFQYLGRLLYKTDDDWPAVRQKIIHARLVIGRLGKQLLWQGVDPNVSASFYRVVVQAILFYWSGTLVLPLSMTKRIEETHMEFLRNDHEEESKSIRRWRVRTYQGHPTSNRGSWLINSTLPEKNFAEYLFYYTISPSTISPLCHYRISTKCVSTNILFHERFSTKGFSTKFRESTMSRK